jgi:hypothetical protein
VEVSSEALGVTREELRRAASQTPPSSALSWRGAALLTLGVLVAAYLTWARQWAKM